MNRLQEQNPQVAAWSDSTVKKIKQVLLKILVETEFLNSTRSIKLNPVWLHSILEEAIDRQGDNYMLPTFNHVS